MKNALDIAANGNANGNNSHREYPAEEQKIARKVEELDSALNTKIDLDKGTVTIAGKVISTSAILNEVDSVARTNTAWVPHAQARIREAAVLRLRLEHNMSWQEIGDALGMSVKGVMTAFYRVTNRFLEPGDVGNLVRDAMKRLNVIGEAAMELYDPERPRSSTEALNTALKVEERRAKLLGLDAPKSFRVTGSKNDVLSLLATAEPLPEEMLTEIQELDPIVVPQGIEDEGSIAHEEAREPVPEPEAAKTEDLPPPADGLEARRRESERNIRELGAELLSDEKSGKNNPPKKAKFAIG